MNSIERNALHLQADFQWLERVIRFRLNHHTQNSVPPTVPFEILALDMPELNGHASGYHTFIYIGNFVRAPFRNLIMNCILVVMPVESDVSKALRESEENTAPGQKEKNGYQRFLLAVLIESSHPRDIFFLWINFCSKINLDFSGSIIKLNSNDTTGNCVEGYVVRFFYFSPERSNLNP